MAKVKSGSGDFAVCPEFHGTVVCVDATPLKLVETKFGPKEKFNFVYELPIMQDNGKPFCVWSEQMTPSSHEKATLFKHMKGWLGRAMTKAEWEAFDTEDMVGKCAEVVIKHVEDDGRLFVNIIHIAPPKSVLAPSGKFTRKQDRDGNGASGGGSPASAPADAGPKPGAPAAWKSTPQAPAALPGEENLKCKVHIGRCEGLFVGDLTDDQLTALADKWLPSAKASAKPTADDRRLITALEWYVADKASKAAAAAAPAPAAAEDADPMEY